MDIFLLSLFLPLWWIQAAAGHGFVHNVVIGGQSYPGWNPFSDPFNNPPPRIVRKIVNDGFVSAGDADLACHHHGDEGTDAIAEVPAGSEVTFEWVYWPGDHQGPVSTYMASCEGDCATFSANSARWFKLDAAGYFPEDRQWAADKLRADGTSWTSVIPANLAPGEYLIRNEQHRATFHHTPVLSKLRSNQGHWKWIRLSIFQ
ncbi:hypothetical protein CC1G_01992 [Coprinopsis cinerea okayama7|uniref:lytic cellulose monooxygenase (C4-dehydrogenating) n=1 Tax=Coprinopsis cinerea (strain Okayama-7 / 130 / ATCC MYA-4618 / FGSC 9003) TaxID=240176 RepID=A8N681_COPC7|nr:hypothetical protein CC1G_01992 [Coprinopsis cinerea okayama7\|eukprot:XP_001830356.2 hypothetical protein CC1G_01992 [Coprinopsis cinerea okayama7\